MKLLILGLAWVAPAMIAELLGWKGIWGAGSAFLDALIPVPVAGGVLHLPSFVIAAFTILSEKRLLHPLKNLIPLIAACVFVGMLSFQIDFDRLLAYFFTDYRPSGSPLRLDSNLLFLFITSDAFWVFFYTAIVKGRRPPSRLWTVLIIVPFCVVGLVSLKYKLSGPKFKIGGTFPGDQRGQEIRLVYTSSGYNEKVLLDWFDSKGYLSRPWANPNTEHSAVYFTTSMQAIKWGKRDLITPDTTVATICLYEQDKSMQLHKGMVDCFSGKETTAQKLERLTEANPTGFEKRIDYWHAQVVLCKDVQLPEGYVSDIALFSICRSVKNNFQKYKERIIRKYGEDSPELEFVKTTANNYNLK